MKGEIMPFDTEHSDTRTNTSNEPLIRLDPNFFLIVGFVVLGLILAGWIQLHSEKTRKTETATKEAKPINEVSPESVIRTSLGMIAGEEMESKPAQVLYQMVETSPQMTIYSVTFMARRNEKVADYTKCFYDKSRKILVEMTRTKMQGMETAYTWTIWHEVSPDHFKDKLPYSNLKLRTTLSEGLRSNMLPLQYPNIPELLEWH
jgi:hypothetical protein